VHAARKHDRRLAAALLAASVAHTPEGEEVLRGARMRAARKPSAVARELLRNFPKSGSRRRRRKRKPDARGRRAAGKNGAPTDKPEIEENDEPLTPELEEDGALDENGAMDENGDAPDGDGDEEISEDAPDELEDAEAS
jgi:hypothetical protein